jgi:glycerol-3-phosphate dehydrogenase
VRRSTTAAIAQQRFDLIVIGAGINGVAIARDAALRGLSVLVLEKGDLASGTTSWSTRLIHGGLRYLEHAEISLVRESLRERERLLKNAPHLVTPMPMILPIYRDAKRGPLTIRAGMILYDVLSFDKSLPRHDMLSAEEVRQAVPGIEHDGLLAGACFYDAQATFAERLAVENALSAAQHGALIQTYARVDRLVTEGAVVRGVEFTDLISGEPGTAQAKVIVNCAGPWVDEVLHGAPDDRQPERMIGGTKGSHLIVHPFPGAPSDAVYYEARDGRAVFIVPWNGFFLIGSTDIRYSGDLDDVRASEEEIEYLIAETNRLIPTAALDREKVLYSYCGVRPLPFKPAGAEGAITRKHVIRNHAPRLRGLLSVIGGKLTTHRSLAEEVVDEVCDQLGKELKCRTAKLPLPGAPAGGMRTLKESLAARSGLPPQSCNRLASIYGIRAYELLDLVASEPSLLEPFDPESGAIGAEVVFALRGEGAVTLADILLRRTMVGFGAKMAVGADEAAAGIAARHLGWDNEKARHEVASYRAGLARFR